MKHLLLSLLLVVTASLKATDLSITAANVIPSSGAVFQTATAGQTIVAGQLVYKLAADRKVYLADCDSATAAVRDCVGIAATSSAAGAPCTYIVEDPALAVAASGLTNGTIYVLSATAGGLAPSADLTTGWYPTIVAIAKSATTIAFRASPIRSATAL